MRLATFTPIFASISIFALGASACIKSGGDCTGYFSGWCCSNLSCRSHTRTTPGWSTGTATEIYRTCDCASEGEACGGFFSPELWCCDGLRCASNGRCVNDALVSPPGFPPSE